MKKKKTDPILIFIYACMVVAGLYAVAQFGYALDITTEAAKVKAAAEQQQKQDNGVSPGVVVESQAPLDIMGLMSTFQNNLTKTELIEPIKDKFMDKKTYTFKVTMLGIVAGLLWLAYRFSNKKKYRKGEEHGSARWATPQEAKKLFDKKNPNNNIILNNDVQMSLNTRVTRKNLNILGIGGSGAGKTRFFVKPNIMQMNTSYVITDPKGELLRSTGKMLEDNGYVVKVFNLINMRNSFNYNPFAYLQDANGNYNDANVMKLINTLMKNTKAEGQSGGEQFWEDATKALLLAIVYFLVYEGNEDEKNFATVMEMLKLAEVKEDEEDYKSPFDFIFEDLEKQDKHHMAVKYYKDYKKAAGKTAKSILISCSVRLSAFNIEDVINLTYKDSINIPEIGEKKTALFVVIPDSDDTFNFLVAMLYTQIFDVLYGLADFKHKGRLPIHVRFMLDEFANIGTIPRFDKLIATMRSREISVNVIIQNMAQLKTMYKDSWESIVGNCDSLLFLGGKEQTSLDYISKALGKETIDTLNRNVSKSHRSNSTSLNEGIVGRDLMTPNEVGEMPDSDCILLIRGLHPFYSPKFKIEKHKNYQLLEDSNPKNSYEISHIKTAVMPRADEEVEQQNDEYEVEEVDDNEEEIKNILASEEGDETMTSIVEIPDDELEKEDDIVIIEEGEGLDEVVEVESMPDDDITIQDFELKEGDTFSDLNFESLEIAATDEYIVDAEEETETTSNN